MYLLDTNVVSETIKPKPAPSVLAWFVNTPDSALHLSTITLGEIRKGITKARYPTRKEYLVNWLEHKLKPWFGTRILSVDSYVAERWGIMLGELQRPLPAIDSLLAATALQHDLCLVTRNTLDFDVPGLRVINPWEYTTSNT